jgi:hypothetical protein
VPESGVGCSSARVPAWQCSAVHYAPWQTPALHLEPAADARERCAVLLVAVLAFLAGRRLRRSGTSRKASPAPSGSIANLLSHADGVSMTPGSHGKASGAAGAPRASSLSARATLATTTTASDSSRLTHDAASRSPGTTRSGHASRDSGRASHEARAAQSTSTSAPRSEQRIELQEAAHDRGAPPPPGGVWSRAVPATAPATASTGYEAAVTRSLSLSENTASTAASPTARAGPSAGIGSGGSTSLLRPAPVAAAGAASGTALPTATGDDRLSDEAVEAVQGVLHEHELQVQTMLGRGGFGTVYYGAPLRRSGRPESQPPVQACAHPLAACTSRCSPDCAVACRAIQDFHH